MSAFIVEKEHITYLVAAATSRAIACDGITWIWNINTEKGTYARGELRPRDDAKALRVANTLRRMNIDSVKARYPDCETAAELPGRIDDDGGDITMEEWKGTSIFAFINPVQVLKACDCLESQSCHCNSWCESEACAFVNSLRGSAIHSLPGYDEAVYGAPKHM